MKRTKTQKGITLIALLVTIVILIILAIVTITSIKNEGILSYAENAAKGYNNAATNEQGILGYYENSLNNYAGGGTIGGGAGDDTTGGDATETYTVSGIWNFKSQVNFSEISEMVDFTSNGTEYTSISVSGSESYYNLYFGETSVAWFEPAAAEHYSWFGIIYGTPARIDFGTEEQEVSKEFYEWFYANATKFVLTDENSVSGVWVLNDESFEASGGMEQEVTFTSNNKQYDSIYAGFGDAKQLYYGTDAVWWNQMSIVLDGSPEPAGWENEAYKTIDFGSERQEVSSGFLTWLKANATKQ